MTFTCKILYYIVHYASCLVFVCWILAWPSYDVVSYLLFDFSFFLLLLDYACYATMILSLGPLVYAAFMHIMVTYKKY